VNSNYGHIAFRELPILAKGQPVRQFDWCVGKLAEDINSRQAVIDYNAPWHKYVGVRDFPCTMYSQFIIRDESLDCFTAMRSQDAIWGFTYDITYFCVVQMLLHACLVRFHPYLRIGKHRLHVGSFHVYEKHFSAIDKIVGSETKEILMPHVTENTYQDVISGTHHSRFMTWLYESLFVEKDEVLTTEVY